MRYRDGFTLIELIVVVSIIATLSSVAILVFGNTLKNNRDQQRIRDLTAVKQALELYRNRMHYYPTSWNSLVPTFLGNLPTDPLNGRKYAYQVLPNTPYPCDNGATIPAVYCTGFLLCAASEGNPSTYTLSGCSSLPANSCGSGVTCDIGLQTD